MTKKLSRTCQITLSAAVVVAGMTFAVPSAAAATTASCPTGVIKTIFFAGFEIPSPADIGFASTGCPGFVDNGAPYVFDVNQLLVANLNFPSLILKHGNVVETCTGVTMISGELEGLNCTPAT